MAFKVCYLFLITLGLLNLVEGRAIHSNGVICFPNLMMGCFPKMGYLESSTSSKDVEETTTTEKMVQKSNELFEISPVCENVLIVIGTISALIILGIVMLPKIHECILYYRRKREYENLD